MQKKQLSSEYEGGVEAFVKMPSRCEISPLEGMDTRRKPIQQKQVARECFEQQDFPLSKLEVRTYGPKWIYPHRSQPTVAQQTSTSVY